MGERGVGIALHTVSYGLVHVVLGHGGGALACMRVPSWLFDAGQWTGHDAMVQCGVVLRATCVIVCVGLLDYNCLSYQHCPC